MAKPKTVQIKKGDVTAECLASAVSAWERNGWTVVDDESSDVEATPAPAEPVLVVEDPADDTEE